MHSALKSLLLAGTGAIAVFGSASHAATAVEAWAPPSDPYLWLEDVGGDRAMTWVKAENVKTLGVLEKDRRFKGLHDAALIIAEAKDRIPTPHFIAGHVFNLWQDADHVQGIWRSASLEEFGRASPNWSTVIDVDALSRKEGKNWVWRGANCLYPDETRCLVSLSDGGEDADVTREFDLVTGKFVTDGFLFPRSKQGQVWEDRDHIIVGREWGPGAMTESGYPYVLKRVARGAALDQAVEVFRGSPKDVAVNAFELRDGVHNRAILIQRDVSFFESEFYLLTKKGPVKIGVPLKTQIRGMVQGRILIEPKQDWTIKDQTFKAGVLVSVDLNALTSNPGQLSPRLVYAPGPRETLDGVDQTKNRLIVTTYENVRGRMHIYTPEPGGGWTSSKVDLPDNASVDVVAADDRSDVAFVSVTGFLTPTTLLRLDTVTGAVSPSKALAAKFDASGHTVEQFEAVSTDGTKVPYFVVRPKSLKYDGSNPTIIYAYGGFEASETPAYSATIGKLWLEQGCVYVLANIRGGGEFGPAWHEAGLKTKRQIIYDDFASVAQDLIARGVTSPRRLGIEGGSNGGLLMGVEFTQHPELWNAVDIKVPLLDMIRMEKIAAGASWVGEYGSMANADERAFWLKTSPYQNLKAGVKYPEPLIWTTTKDDRVGPQHARKFAARLAEMGVPYLFYEVTEGGHGAGANLKEKAHTNALEYTYFARKLID